MNCVCVHVSDIHVRLHPVHLCADAAAAYRVSSSISLCLTVLRLGLSLNQKLAVLARLSNQQAFRIHPSLLPDAGIIGTCKLCLYFFMSAGDSNSGLLD